MTKKKIQSLNSLVYSTDPHFKLSDDGFEELETIEPGQQKLKIRLDTKHRAGKAVTLVEGFEGTLSDREALGKKLKSVCGTGGSVKDGEIMVQGDNRERILLWLQKHGYKHTKKN